MAQRYDPFAIGAVSWELRTIEACDPVRGSRVFPCDIWYPSARSAAPQPLIVFSHSSGGDRRQSTFLTEHLASHGYIVAALNHSDIVAPELRRTNDETPEQTAARIQMWIANRVPDVSFLIDYIVNCGADWMNPDPLRIGIIGHSFGGWTALASAEADPRIGAIVALSPAGNSKPLPGIIPATLTFVWKREVPTLYLAAELDTAIPLPGIRELFERTPSPKQLVVLRRADHAHFMNNAEQLHEGFRLSSMTGDIAAMARSMRPFAELCSTESAHSFTRALALAHMDAYLRDRSEARQWLEEDLQKSLSAHGIDASFFD